MTPQDVKPQAAQQSTAALLDSIVQETEVDLRRTIITQEIARRDYQYDDKLARTFFASGIFDELNKLSPEQGVALALTKIRIGRSWGISEADSMWHIYFSKGRPCPDADIQATALRKAGYSWDVEYQRDENGLLRACVLWAKFNGQPIVDRNGDPMFVTFGKSQADAMKLSDKDTYKADPESMYFARAITRFRKRIAPEVLSGAADVEDLTGWEEAPATESKLAKAVAEAVAAKPVVIEGTSAPEVLGSIQKESEKTMERASAAGVDFFS